MAAGTTALLLLNSVKEVNETCLELLHYEIVAWAVEKATTPEDREIALKRVEAIGHAVGARLVERHSKGHARLADTMDQIRFICREFWPVLFRKQIDNLRTNHKGTFVLLDQNFQWFARLGAAAQSPQVSRAYSAFACGLICGALANLGVVSTVTVEVLSAPQCTFKVVVTK